MVSIVSLWLPILISAVLVFFASFVLHMVIPFHRPDYKKLPAEDDTMEALRRFNIPPGDYMVPCAGGPEAFKDPAFKAKFEKGPVLIMTIMKPGPMSLGKNLGQWFVYCLVVSVIAAYVAGRAVGPAAPFAEVLRFAGVASFLSYTLAIWQMSIWYHRQWGTTIRYTVDGLIFSLLTGVSFAMMWPK